MKGNKAFLVVTALVVLAVFGAAAYVMRAKQTPDANFDPVRADASLLVAAHSYVKGPADAKVTIVEFLDPECEACRGVHSIVKRVMTEYEGKVKLVVRYMAFHKNADFAAATLEEAREAGKYEEALDLLFEKQPEWGSHHAPRPELIPGYLETLGLKASALKRETVLAKHGSKIQKDMEDGRKLGVDSTPTFFVNGRTLYQLGYAPLKALIDEELARANN